MKTLVRKIAKIFSGNLKKNTPQAQPSADRAPRVRIHHFHNIELKISEPSSDWAIQIANLSNSGIGFLVEGSEKIPGNIPGFRGVLQLENQEFPIHAKTIWQKGNFIGGKFENPASELSAALQRYFATEISALRLYAVKSSYLKSQMEGDPHWFQGSEDFDLYFISSGSEIRYCIATMHEKILECGRDLPISEGILVEADERDGRMLRRTPLVERKAKVEEDTLILARRFVLGIDGIEKSHQQNILRLLGGKNLDSI